jgi:hypothetical protein
MPNFEITGIAISSMFIYGGFALTSPDVSFDWHIAGGIILFAFIIEMAIIIVKWTLEGD